MCDGAVTVTGTLQREAWLDRTTPPVEQVRPGVWSIPIDFGHAPIRYTFCYVLVAPSGEAVIVDPGGDSPLGRRQLAEGLAIAGVGPGDVVGVVSTHVHLDHVGMIGHAAAIGGGAWIGYHERDYEVVRLYGSPRAQDSDREWLRRCGTPQPDVERIVIDRADYETMASLPAPTLMLSDGDVLPVEGLDVRVVATPGHTPGHICLIDESRGLFFSGDHVLPRITPNVGMTSTGTRHDVLSGYYGSLSRTMTVGDGFEVCPAHEYRFTGLAARCADLVVHHEERSDAIVESVGEGRRTVWEIAASTPWARPWESFDGVNLRAALGETAAHVDHLVATRRLDVADTDPLRVSRAQPPISAATR